MTEGLLVSVVVAVKDDDRVRRLLASLLAQTLSTDAYEVIVVENGSTKFGDIVGAPDGLMRYFHLSQANTAAARNVGLRAAYGKYVLFTDSDCVAEPDWLDRMTAALATGAAVVGGRIGKYQPKTWVQRHAITIMDGQLRPGYLPALDVPYVAGANAGFDAAVLRSVGGFDETLYSGNDVDVCYKIGLAGHRLQMAEYALIWHDDRPDVVAHFRRFYRYAVYQVLLFAKYKHESGKRFVIDGYPFRRVADGLTQLPGALRCLVDGDASPVLRVALQLIEAAAVLCGEISGAIRFRQPYL